MKQAAVSQGALSNPISRWALEERLEASFRMLPRDVHSVLDMGCGEGHFLAMIEKRLPSTKLVGVDLSEENIHYARRILKRVKLICGDASRVRLPNSSFDVVSALELLDHMDSDTALLSKAKSLLKPKGTLIISIPDSGMLLWRFIWGLWTRTLGRRWSGKHLREYDEDGLVKLLRGEGFRVKSKARAIFGTVMVFACEKSQ